MNAAAVESVSRCAVACLSVMQALRSVDPAQCADARWVDSVLGMKPLLVQLETAISSTVLPIAIRRASVEEIDGGSGGDVFQASALNEHAAMIEALNALDPILLRCGDRLEAYYSVSSQRPPAALQMQGSVHRLRSICAGLVAVAETSSSAFPNAAATTAEAASGEDPAGGTDVSSSSLSQPSSAWFAQSVRNFLSR